MSNGSGPPFPSPFEQMDVFVSSRNNLWVSFVLPYFWFNGFFFFIFSLSLKSAYLFCVVMTAMLDLWRHANIVPQKRILSIIFYQSFSLHPMSACLAFPNSFSDKLSERSKHLG